MNKLLHFILLCLLYRGMLVQSGPQDPRDLKENKETKEKRLMMEKFVILSI